MTKSKKKGAPASAAAAGATATASATTATAAAGASADGTPVVSPAGGGAAAAAAPAPATGSPAPVWPALPARGKASVPVTPAVREIVVALIMAKADVLEDALRRLKADEELRTAVVTQLIQVLTEAPFTERPPQGKSVQMGTLAESFRAGGPVSPELAGWCIFAMLHDNRTAVGKEPMWSRGPQALPGLCALLKRFLSASARPSVYPVNIQMTPFFFRSFTAAAGSGMAFARALAHEEMVQVLLDTIGFWVDIDRTVLSSAEMKTAEGPEVGWVVDILSFACRTMSEMYKWSALSVQPKITTAMLRLLASRHAEVVASAAFTLERMTFATENAAAFMKQGKPVIQQCIDATRKLTDVAEAARKTEDAKYTEVEARLNGTAAARASTERMCVGASMMYCTMGNLAGCDSGRQQLSGSLDLLPLACQAIAQCSVEVGGAMFKFLGRYVGHDSKADLKVVKPTVLASVAAYLIPPVTPHPILLSHMCDALFMLNVLTRKRAPRVVEAIVQSPVLTALVGLLQDLSPAKTAPAWSQANPLLAKAIVQRTMHILWNIAHSQRGLHNPALRAAGVLDVVQAYRSGPTQRIQDYDEVNARAGGVLAALAGDPTYFEMIEKVDAGDDGIPTDGRSAQERHMYETAVRSYLQKQAAITAAVDTLT